MRDREILIDRTCARCGCEYEWGVHVAYFAGRVGLDAEQIRSITFGGPSDPCWVDERDRRLLRVADELHDRSTVTDALFHDLEEHFTEAQLRDIFLLCGWYHAISYAANASAVEREPFAPVFADHAEPASGSAASPLIPS